MVRRSQRIDNGTGVAPEFTPKRNSELRDNRGRRPTTRCVSSLSGKPGTLLCPAPLKTGRASFPASGSSKP